MDMVYIYAVRNTIRQYVVTLIIMDNIAVYCQYVKERFLES